MVIKAGLLKNITSIAIATIMISASCIDTASARSVFEDPMSRSASGSSAISGGLIAVEEEVDGGSIAIGAAANVVTLFRNEGTRPIEVGKINLYPSSTVSSNITLNQCAKGALPPLADCAVVVSIKGLQEGAWRVEMLMSHNGKSKLVKATLAGDIEAGADGDDSLSSDVETIPSEIDFSTLSSSQTLIKSVIFRNITSEVIDIKDIAINASKQAGYSVSSNCARINTGESCIATISWTPQIKGPSEGFLVINHTGPSKISSVNLKGEFTPETSSEAEIFPEAVPGRGLLVSSASMVDFGTGIENTSAMTISLVNVGDTTLNMSNISLSGADNGISIQRKGCVEKKILEPIEACPLTVSWSPPREGAILDDVQVEHDGARGILVIPVRGDASKAVSKDSKAIIEKDGVQEDVIDKTEVLDGFVVTSHSKNKAIISGPGGSRVVKHGEDIIMGAVSWKVQMIDNGVGFINGKDKIILLFDKSLSSVDRFSTSSSAVSATTTDTTGGN